MRREEQVRSAVVRNKIHLVLPLGRLFGWGLACTGEKVNRFDIRVVNSIHISCPECKEHI